MDKASKGTWLFAKLLTITSMIMGAFPIYAQINAPRVIDLFSMDEASRLGISVTIDNGRAEYYLLDTGSSPFTTAWASNAPWWPNAGGVNTNDTNSNLVYGPGSGETQFYYYPATNSVSLGSGYSAVSASISIAGEYAKYTNQNSPSSSNANWVLDPSFSVAITEAVSHSNVAPQTGGFFGILGADLSNSNNGLLSLIDSQTYGSNVVRGFILNGMTNHPTLTIAPTVSIIQSFTNVFQMNTNADGSIMQNVISPSYSISLSNGFTTNIGKMPTLLDSGTPPEDKLFITQGSNVDVSSFTTNIGTSVNVTNVLEPGVSISMLVGTTPYLITSDSNHPITVYGSPTDAKAGGITYGLNFFENYNVLYDLQNQTVGIEAVPEPATQALLGLGFLGLVIAVMRRPSSSLKGMSQLPQGDQR